MQERIPASPPAASAHSQDIPGLIPVLRSARDQSLRLGRPVLARATLPLPSFLGLDAIRLPSHEDFVVWHSCEGKQVFVGLGRAVRLADSGATALANLQTRLKTLVADLPDTDFDTSLPLCFAGAVFDPEQPNDEVWRDFEDAMAFVPRFLLAHRDNESTLTINLMVDVSTDLDREARRLASEVQDLNREIEAGSIYLDFQPTSELQSDQETKAAWLEAVVGLKQDIADSRAQKVVLARRAHLKSDADFSIDLALDRLRQRYSNCTIFAVRSGESCFVGATPERLVALDGHELRIDSLAGSAPRGADAVEDAAIGAKLLVDKKELWEHDLVTRGVVESLEGLCQEIRMPSDPRLQRMANVQHLHTPIEATIAADTHILSLVERLHPTPATAGLPRIEALQLIRAAEPFQRGWYAGPIGWIDARGGGEFAVALRSALVRGKDAWLFAGCGIVDGSEPEREYRESRLKLEAMLWALDAQP